ncbi:MAG: hypothetical protein ACYC9L_05630 [Sulfuricaulis sp.]
MADAQVFRTSFREYPDGVYETRKKDALEKHLRMLAEAVSRSATVRPCHKCVGSSRSWINLQEYENPFADYCRRSGDWITELELEPLP